MNNQLLHKTFNANPTKSDLLRELENETGMARRQELFKAIWKLDPQATLLASLRTARRQAAATTKPESEVGRRQFSNVQDADRRPKAHAESPIENKTHENADNRSCGITNDKPLLNELYALERFSLANYLRYAKPWVATDGERLAEAIRHIGDQQQEFAERVGSLIIKHRGHVVGGSFPFHFTAYNDLSLAYLTPRVMEDQERIVRRVNTVARQLRGETVACALANKILSAEQSHLASLRKLLSEQKCESSRMSEVAVFE